jgi:hypothetical protein
VGSRVCIRVEVSVNVCKAQLAMNVQSVMVRYCVSVVTCVTQNFSYVGLPHSAQCSTTVVLVHGEFGSGCIHTLI